MECPNCKSSQTVIQSHVSALSSVGQIRFEMLCISCGIAFANGISIRAVTGIADANTGAPGTNDVVVNLVYA